jgi:PHD/YefM family antitoxin component YafN of YafNO toxin-antitoxin module
MGVDEARSRLSELLAGLSPEPGGEPVVMGAYRRPQGVLVSVEEYETLLEVYEQHLRRRETEAALATVRAEGGEPTPDVIGRSSGSRPGTPGTGLPGSA